MAIGSSFLLRFTFNGNFGLIYDAELFRFVKDELIVLGFTSIADYDPDIDKLGLKTNGSIGLFCAFSKGVNTPTLPPSPPSPL